MAMLHAFDAHPLPNYGYSPPALKLALWKGIQNSERISHWSNAVKWDVIEINVVGGFSLSVRFQDGLEGEVKLLPTFFRGVFEHLATAHEFQKVQVVDGVVTWLGELGLAPDAMYEEIRLSGRWLLN